MDDAEFEISEPLPLSAGDIILLSTDGLKEAHSRDGAELGIEQVLSVLHATRRQAAAAIVGGLFAQMQTFIAGEAISDDVTAVVVKCLDAIDSEPSGNHRPQATRPLEAEASPVDN
jgi:serine phosphatase RsbU (regulator of sigma subunit)